ncbi:hypothetical protein L596_022385 [Steinernema carpocapsae]|uniref:Uncharacterized protein n=1 Tax=Steinernema carpocapsae TaxID=34508 RepID=A0A4U5MLJ2_STECR|nr:hypothetical protein L596_022385 [Steinernema carpocapsae]
MLHNFHRSSSTAAQHGARNHESRGDGEKSLASPFLNLPVDTKGYSVHTRRRRPIRGGLLIVQSDLSVLFSGLSSLRTRRQRSSPSVVEQFHRSTKAVAMNAALWLFVATSACVWPDSRADWPENFKSDLYECDKTFLSRYLVVGLNGRKRHRNIFYFEAWDVPGKLIHMTHDTTYAYMWKRLSIDPFTLGGDVNMMITQSDDQMPTKTCAHRSTDTLGINLKKRYVYFTYETWCKGPTKSDKDKSDKPHNLKWVVRSQVNFSFDGVMDDKVDNVTRYFVRAVGHVHQCELDKFYDCFDQMDKKSWKIRFPIGMRSRTRMALDESYVNKIYDHFKDKWFKPEAKYGVGGFSGVLLKEGALELRAQLTSGTKDEIVYAMMDGRQNPFQGPGSKACKYATLNASYFRYVYLVDMTNLNEDLGYFEEDEGNYDDTRIYEEYDFNQYYIDAIEKNSTEEPIAPGIDDCASVTVSFVFFMVIVIFM